MEPLAAEWAAPPHPFLLEEQGEPAVSWVRRGPAALTRAWCIFELAKALALRRTLHVLLSPASVRLFEARMTKHAAEFADGLAGFQWIGQILGRIDVKLAQISKAVDREYIVREVKTLDGGLGAINANVMGALRGWLTSEAKALLARLPEAERWTSVLCNNVAIMLEEVGRLAEAEELKREVLAAERKKGGARGPNTLIALGNLALNLMQQGKLAEAEPLFRESLEARRATFGDNDQDTLSAVGNLGRVLQEQGKLEEAEPLLVEAVAWAKKNGINPFAICSLVELRREQGRLAEAEEELSWLMEHARNVFGPQAQDTLHAEATAARLKHAQPGGAAAGQAELRAVVERMGEFLGAAHQDTVKWRAVLDAM